MLAAHGNRVQGANALPVAARVETEADALFLLREEAAVRRFDAIAGQTLQRYPELAGWLERRCMRALDHADDWPNILAVLDYFVRHPRPGVYLRQLDIPGVDTKFIESRRRPAHGELLDVVLPADGIRHAAARAREVRAALWPENRAGADPLPGARRRHRCPRPDRHARCRRRNLRAWSCPYRVSS
ncbi:MAG: DUF3322 domain-containing protein [Gammaproteobacteria bacterium]|nr:DUF3322 domain-containing protein [Gammaproteobacteria bacterium]